MPDENPNGLGAFDLPLRLPGQYFDKETNLHYNYHRTYDPAVGRYTRSDPVGLSDGPSTYAYVRSNPLIGVDLRGLTTYRGFDPQQENQMRQAVEEAKQKIQNCGNCKQTCSGNDDCFPDDDLKKDLVDKLEKATFVYKPGLKYCAYVGPIDFWLNRVDISNLAFGPTCCPLASTLAHEAYHLVGVLDPVPYKLEDKCFGCAHYPK